MSVKGQISNAKVELEEVIKREIVILRELLLSLSCEETAITSGDVELYDEVFERRIDIIAKFELWADKLLKLTQLLAEDKGIKLPHRKHFCHLEAVLMLDRCFQLEDATLSTLRQQLLSLLEKIYTQNDRIARIVKDPRYSFQFSKADLSPVELSAVPHPLKKQLVTVIDTKK